MLKVEVVMQGLHEMLDAVDHIYYRTTATLRMAFNQVRHHPWGHASIENVRDGTAERPKDLYRAEISNYSTK